MNLLQMSFTGAVMILAVTVIRALAINKCHFGRKGMIYLYQSLDVATGTQIEWHFVPHFSGRPSLPLPPKC